MRFFQSRNFSKDDICRLRLQMPKYVLAMSTFADFVGKYRNVFLQKSTFADFVAKCRNGIFPKSKFADFVGKFRLWGVSLTPLTPLRYAPAGDPRRLTAEWRIGLN